MLLDVRSIAVMFVAEIKDGWPDCANAQIMMMWQLLQSTPVTQKILPQKVV